jgi:general stress protein YciG
MNTPDGVVKAKETMKRYGFTEDGKNKFFVEIGKIGGKSRNPNKGWGNDRERARTDGRKGGHASSRSWSEAQRLEYGETMKKIWQRRKNEGIN